MKFSFLEKILIWWGLFWGALGMGLYFLGLLGLFYRSIAIVFGFFCLLLFLYFFQKTKVRFSWKPFRDWVTILILGGFGVFAVFNFLLLLAPEVGFDALWYHLTLPKIYLATHHVSYLPGGLLYYSVMPRLAEMIYGWGLALDPAGNIPKIIHYLFGLAWFGGTYLVGRQFLSRRYALLAALASYATYLVTWLSQTAYIDLIVAFYAAMALWGIFKYLSLSNDVIARSPSISLGINSATKQSPISFLYLAAIFMGLTLSSKLYGLFLFAVVLLILIIKASWRAWLKFVGISFVIVFPFYLQAELATGNPFYPVFSVRDSALEMYTNGYSELRDWYLNLWWKNLPALFWQTLVYRFTPVFSLSLLFFFGKNWRKIILPLLIFMGFFFFWSLNPVQELRYFMAILPVIGVVSFYTWENIDWRYFRYLAFLLFLVGLIYNLTFGLGRFKETVELVLGKNSKENYLRSRLEPPRNFYDFSGRFGREIGNKRVLTANVHNLFYLNFSFWDWSFIEKDYLSKPQAEGLADKLKKDGFDYILIGDWDILEWSGLPKEEVEKYFHEVLKENGFTLYRIVNP